MAQQWVHMKIFFNRAEGTFNTYQKKGSIELYSAPDEKARRTHAFGLDNEDFRINIHSKFSDKHTYIEIQIRYNGTILCPLCACIDETINGKRSSSHSSYYHWFRLKNVSFEDWNLACEVISNVYINKDVWLLNEAPIAVEKFNLLLDNKDVSDQYKLFVCKVFIGLIEDCKLKRYNGISYCLSKNCRAIQQLAINAINHDTDFDTGIKVMESLYNLMKESELLKEFYHQLDCCHE